MSRKNDSIQYLSDYSKTKLYLDVMRGSHLLAHTWANRAMLHGAFFG